MSNNTFTNNRFHFLDDDNNKAPFKSVKKEKKTALYESSNNSFSRDRERPRYNDYPSHNSFRQINKESSKTKEVKSFNIQEIEFPEIHQSIKASNETSSDSFKFKDALNKKKDKMLNSELAKNTVKPGWVEISRVNRKTVIKEGQLTPYFIEQKKKEEYEKTTNYLMNTAITTMIKRWERYIEEYNSIHGDGAYEELYVLPHTYGPEYDTEEELEDSNDSDDSGYL